ncbi:MAG: alpha/beta hydrolase [Deltaproteobacteria bacterium]|nr:alpha/beta hydrolase [Deltaproteobacteria bacterium]
MSAWLDHGDSLVESRIFYPERAFWEQPADYGLAVQDLWLTTADGLSLHAWHLPAKESPWLLLFCHGNAGNISHRLDNLHRLHQAGIGVLIFDYRGYGQSEGSPSEKGLYVDSEAAWAAAGRLAAAAGRTPVIFGRSLGGAAAVYLAARHQPAAVILESTFTNLADLARQHFALPLPRAWLARRFDNLGRIQGVRAPLLFLHGDADDIVPWELGRALYEAAPGPKEFRTIPGAGHNDTYDRAGPAYFSWLRDFLTVNAPPPAPAAGLDQPGPAK